MRSKTCVVRQKAKTGRQYVWVMGICLWLGTGDRGFAKGGPSCELQHVFGHHYVVGGGIVCKERRWDYFKWT